jgi:hypothetical protein
MIESGELLPDLPRSRIEAAMIANDDELTVMLQCITCLQQQGGHRRTVEVNPNHYRAPSSGFWMEIDRMQLEVREFLSQHASELAGGV